MMFDVVCRLAICIFTAINFKRLDCSHCSDLQIRCEASDHLEQSNEVVSFSRVLWRIGISKEKHNVSICLIVYRNTRIPLPAFLSESTDAVQPAHHTLPQTRNLDINVSTSMSSKKLPRGHQSSTILGQRSNRLNMLSLIDPHEPYDTGQPKDPSKLELLRLTKGSLKLGLGCVTLCDVVWRVNNLQTRDIQDMQDTEQHLQHFWNWWRKAEWGIVKVIKARCSQHRLQAAASHSLCLKSQPPIIAITCWEPLQLKNSRWVAAG